MKMWLDVSSLQIDQRIQCSPNQNSSVFHKNWQTDSKIDVNTQRFQNDQEILKNKIKGLRLPGF